MKSTFKNIVAKILTWEARRVLNKHKPKIIVVTGSVGKTGTKDAVYTMFAQTEFARKSEKSFNSELGVPLTILGLPNAWSSIVGWMENIAEGFILPWDTKEYPKWLILEVGVDRPGDIKRLSWLNPNIVIFTQFPDVPVHVEYFKSPEDVMNEKRSLKEYLQPDGTLIINADDPKMAHEEVYEGQHKLSYGCSEDAMVRGFDYVIMYDNEKPIGISFSVQFQEKVERVEIQGILGRHHMYPTLAALTAVISEGKLFSQAVHGYAEHIPAPGRMRILDGINNSVIVDDTYNSSPVAAQAGLDTIATVETRGRKIVVLGDMLELGDFSMREHQNLGQIVAQTADMFVAVGVRMLAAAEAVSAIKARCGYVEAFQNREDAIDFLTKTVSEYDVVYVKGSQGMRMERIVENLLVEPRESMKLLARQDTVWKSIA